MFGVDSSQKADFSAFDVVLEAWNSLRDSIGCGVFPGRKFGVVELTKYYYGTLKCLNLTTQKEFQ